MDTTPRLAVRGIILIENRLLLVNAYADRPNRLWCLPGGGVEPGASLPETLCAKFTRKPGFGFGSVPWHWATNFIIRRTGFIRLKRCFAVP